MNDKPLLSLVKEEPLLRIYTYYDLDKDGKSWFSDFPKVITKDGLKFIIPMGGGLIMISYTDSVYAENMMMNGFYITTSLHHIPNCLIN